MLGAQPAIPLVGDVMRYTLAPLAGRVLWRTTLRRAFAPRPVAAAFRALPPWIMLRPSQVRASAADAALMVPAAMAQVGEPQHQPDARADALARASESGV